MRAGRRRRKRKRGEIVGHEVGRSPNSSTCPLRPQREKERILARPECPAVIVFLRSLPLSLNEASSPLWRVHGAQVACLLLFSSSFLNFRLFGFWGRDSCTSARNMFSLRMQTVFFLGEIHCFQIKSNFISKCNYFFNPK